jgi:tripartite ATP-independent transporter DctP family solute receptor
MRKTLLILAILVLAVSVSVTGAGQQEVEKKVLKVGLIDPPGHIDVAATERMAELVSEKTNGSLELEIYPASQLGFAMDLLEGMTVGTVEMFVGATTWLGAFESDYWISGTLYLFNDQEHARDIHGGEIFEGLAETVRENHGIRILTQNWDRGPRNFIATKPIADLNDFQGLKIRVPEQKSWIENFRLAGANPTPIALVETFTGLQQGVVESTEQASNWLYFNKYHTVAENLTLSNHNYEETGVMISDVVFESLTPSQQDALVEAAQEVTDWHNQKVLEDIELAEEKMAEEGVNIIEIDQDAWKAHFRAIIPELAEVVGYSPELLEAIQSTWD